VIKTGFSHCQRFHIFYKTTLAIRGGPNLPARYYKTDPHFESSPLVWHWTWLNANALNCMLLLSGYIV